MLSASVAADTKVTITGEVDIGLWFDVDVTVTLDADGTMTVDNSGVNIIDPIQVPDWLVPDNMTPVSSDIGTVSEEGAAVVIGLELAEAIIGGITETLPENINDVLGDFIDWLNGPQAPSGGPGGGPMFTEEEIAAGILDPELAVDIVQSMGTGFSQWLRANP
ncbi:MAG: hypothetical protein DHS20C15_24370 [Planctomycetota bacterium]|nr:MAG: hypothetical protein DHS20C15_24370 [Planctomycetota bacterium]